MGLSQNQKSEVETIAELQVRRYFDQYLTEVFPKQVATLIRAHDTSVFAHGGVARRFSRAKYLLMGFCAAGGLGAGAGLRELLSFLH